MRILSHSHTPYTQVLHWRERKRERVYRGRWETILATRVLHCTWLNYILRNVYKVFWPLVVSLRKIFMFSCVFVLVFISVILCLWLWCYDDKCFRSFITITNLTWCHSHRERSLCAAETILQLLKIRVSCLKSQQDKD